MVGDLETESFLDVNLAACDLLGYSREELLAMHPEDIHPNDVECVREEFIFQVNQEGSGFTDDLTCLTKDGDSPKTAKRFRPKSPGPHSTREKMERPDTDDRDAP